MKRPMILAGTGALLISATLVYASRLFPFIIAAFAVVAIFLMLFKRTRTPEIIFILFIILAVLCTSALSLNKIEKLKSFEDEVTVSGTVTTVKNGEGFVVYTVKSDMINKTAIKVNCSVMSESGFYAVPGDVVTFSATVGESDKYLPNGSRLSLYEARFSSVDSGENIYGLFYNIRQYIRALIFENMPYESAAMLLGILLGDNTGMSLDMMENIKSSGVSHIVVVSGMHLAIITKFFLAKRKESKKYRVLLAPLGILVVTAFIVLTGFTPSVMRAAVTYYIIFFGMLIARRPDALSSLFAASVLLVLHNPFIAGNLSFQLSAAATFGVLVVSPVLQNIIPQQKGRVNKFFCSLWGIIATTLSATLMTMPFIIAQFGFYSSVAVVTNMFITHPSGIALVTAALGALVSFIPAASRALFAVADVFTRFMNAVIDALGRLPFATIPVKNPAYATVLISIFVIILALYCIAKYDEIKFGDNYARSA